MHENEMFLIRLVQFLISLFQTMDSFCTRVAADVIKFQSLCFLIFGLQKTLALMLLQYHTYSLFSNLPKSCPFSSHDANKSRLRKLNDVIPWYRLSSISSLFVMNFHAQPIDRLLEGIRGFLKNRHFGWVSLDTQEFCLELTIFFGFLNKRTNTSPRRY